MRDQKNFAASEVCQSDRISFTVSLVGRRKYEKLHAAAARKMAIVVMAFDVSEIDKF